MKHCTSTCAARPNWRDFGYGDFDLHFIRDKEKREVDFLLTKDNKPWILIEVKANYKESLSKSLKYFSDILQVPHAFQVAEDLNYQGVDLFQNKNPQIVSMREFLSYFP